jgi:hypothetical protein
MKIPFDPYDFFGYLASGLVIIIGFELTTGFPNVIGAELSTVETALLIVAVYVAGQVIATPAKAVLEDFIIDKILARPSVNLFRTKTPVVRRILFPGFLKPYPKGVRERIESVLQENDINGVGDERFLPVRYNEHVTSNDKLMAKLSSFLNKYGFARNLSFVCLLVGIVLLFKDLLNEDVRMVEYWASFLVVGILLFYRYLKFFRQYSFEMFQAYAAIVGGNE